MFSTVYLSTSTVEFEEADLAALLTKSRAENAARGVTGLLLFKDGRFIQALEGPEDVVRSTLATIVGDPRHGRIQVLAEEQIEVRRFPDWSMGYRKLDDAAAATAPGYLDILSGGRDGLPNSPSLVVTLLDWFRTH